MAICEGDRVAYSADHLNAHAIKGGPIFDARGRVLAIRQIHGIPVAIIDWGRGIEVTQGRHSTTPVLYMVSRLARVREDGK